MPKHPTLPSLCLLTIAVAAGLPLASCNKDESQQTNFQMGDRVTAKPMVYNVVQTVWRTQLGNLFTVRVPERRFLLISLSATNTGGKPVAVPFFTLEGSNREEYRELQTGYVVDNWFGLLREIAPGETKQGNIVFDVPLASYRLRLTNGGEPGSERLVWVDIPLRIDTDTSATTPLPGQ
jgi:hypothetical protein